jgi:hypothetical protein
MGGLVGPMIMGALKTGTDNYRAGLIVVACSELLYAFCTVWIRYEVNRRNSSLITNIELNPTSNTSMNSVSVGTFLLSSLLSGCLSSCEC